MAAKTKNKHLYNISDIHITNHTISWENHIVRVPEIARIWIGRIPSRPFPAKTLLILLFLTLSAPHPVSLLVMSVLLAIISVMMVRHLQPDNTGPQIHIGLRTGEILSFAADHETSATQFYDSLKQAAEGNIKSETIFDTEGNIKEDDEEPLQQTPSVTDLSIMDVQQNPLINELQKLYQSIMKKTNVNSEILHLINEIANLLEAGNREGLKPVFEQFITLGLIGDCNELGLESLIQEIKSSLY